MQLRPNSFGSLTNGGIKSRAGNCASGRAFTLLEMLVVLVIIGIIAALALPHIRGHSESVAINAACHQLVEDLSYARQRAISQRSTVAVVFVSPAIFDSRAFPYNNTQVYNTKESELIKRLQGGVYTHYALYQYRKVGEQPGSYQSYGYITEWKALPEKTFIDTNDFPGAFFTQEAKFPFPLSTSVKTDQLPYIAFDSEGRCVQVDKKETGIGTPVRDVDIHVARGSVLYTRQPDNSVLSANFDVQEIPPFNGTNNVVHVDFLTGRAKRLELQLQ
jgi:prepilin-type N-terminal cleavage/methylation domain-containing protein